MIAYFPSIYEDELLYSQLARFYATSGYLAYAYVAEDLFALQTTSPNIEFVNTYTPDALKEITRNLSMEQIVLKHTMFPYYGRFVPRERRVKAFQALVNMTGNYHNLLPLPLMPLSKSGSQRRLRYCPMCAARDREKYKETYWHRTPQMIGISVCPVHKCYLTDSNVIIRGKVQPSLKAAEISIPYTETPVFTEKEIEIRIAKYMETVFQADVDMNSTIAVGDFLHAKTANTPYRTTRGAHRNITLFHNDFAEFYKDLPDDWILNLEQIQKILTNVRTNFFEICLMALFLHVPADELVHMTAPTEKQCEIFDAKTCELLEQSLSYPEIAKILNVSRATVQFVSKRKSRINYQRRKKLFKGGAKPKDWSQFDVDTLPLVREAIKQLQDNETTRPKRVSVFAVQKILNLPSQKIVKHLPRCYAEIRKYEESRQQYWARKLVWAVRRIVNDGTVLQWSQVVNLTRMRREQYTACLPYINDYADEKTAELIMRL